MTTNPDVIPHDIYNGILVDNVHPSGWENPEPAGRYNLVVIGAGTAGLISAAGAAALGAKVALIECHLMGGDCLNVGCVPSKGMLRAARALFDGRNSGEFGVLGGGGLGFDFGVAMERMRRLRSDISRHDSARRFRDELGVDIFIGPARFSGPDCVEVGDKKLFFRKAAVCSGARAAAPPIPGLAEAGYLTNETVFSLTELPPRLAVIGAGPVGCEMAQAFARFGSRVTLVERGPRLLDREDPDAAGILQAALVSEGVDLRFGAAISGVETRGDSKVLHLKCNGELVEVVVDEILVGVGRAPNVEGLELEAAGIKL
jgi:pyruvate/2-oxoglutarate dehydrogenase complex dihydrolipoamide dehydrogenase (E3) component